MGWFDSVRRYYKMIRIYTGLPRQGKTLNMVSDIIPQMELGRRIITNTPIWCYIKGRKVNADFYDDKDEYQYHFLNGERCLIVCDESSLYFASLKWNRLSLDFWGKFRQAGKMGADLYCTSQSWIDTVSNLRRMADQATVCRKYHWLIPFPLINLRMKIYDKKKGFYKMVGPYVATPWIYRMMYVNPQYFNTHSQNWEYIQKLIYRVRLMYPSESKRIMQCYDHEKQITSSAVGTIHVFGKDKKIQENIKERIDILSKPDEPNKPAQEANPDELPETIPEVANMENIASEITTERPEIEKLMDGTSEIKKIILDTK